MQLPYKKRSALSLAVLVTALAAFVGASVGSAAPTAKVPIPANPLTADIAKVAGLKIKGGFPGNPRDQKLLELAKAEGGVVNVQCHGQIFFPGGSAVADESQRTVGDAADFGVVSARIVIADERLLVEVEVGGAGAAAQGDREEERFERPAG